MQLTKSTAIFLLVSLFSQTSLAAKLTLDGGLDDDKPAVATTVTAAPPFKCGVGPRAEKLAEVTSLFTAIGVPGVTQGKVLQEQPGNGNPVTLIVNRGPSFQMTMRHAVAKGTLPASVCWEGQGDKPASLRVHIDASSLGESRFDVIIRRVTSGTVHMAATTERARQLINYKYDVVGAAR